jgi:hypothetical protein
VSAATVVAGALADQEKEVLGDSSLPGTIQQLASCRRAKLLTPPDIGRQAPLRGSPRILTGRIWYRRRSRRLDQSTNEGAEN